MGLNHAIAPRRLKPFRAFLPERLRGRLKGRASVQRLKEETLEGIITGGSAIVIGNTATDKERADAINGFAEDISDMSGEKIFALAVVFD